MQARTCGLKRIHQLFEVSFFLQSFILLRSAPCAGLEISGIRLRSSSAKARRTTREEGQQQQSWRVMLSEAVNGITGFIDDVLQGKSCAKPGWLARMANTCMRGGLRYVCRMFLGQA